MPIPTMGQTRDILSKPALRAIQSGNVKLEGFVHATGHVICLSLLKIGNCFRISSLSALAIVESGDTTGIYYCLYDADVELCWLNLLSISFKST